MTDKARELLAEALRERNENRLAGMAKIPGGLDQVATSIAIAAINAALRTAPAIDLGRLRIPASLASVAEKIKRFDVCAEDCDNDGVDISREWFDALTTIGLLRRVQRSPAMWEMTEAGQSLVDLIDSQGTASAGAVEMKPVAWVRFCSDGCYEGPVMDDVIEDVCRKSGAWTPLYALAAAQEGK